MPLASHIVQVFLPLNRRDGTPQSTAEFQAVRQDMLERCGGVTVYARAPAEGLWKGDDRIEADRIVIFEAMDDRFDQGWWASYRTALQERFDQDEILIRAVAAVRI